MEKFTKIYEYILNDDFNSFVSLFEKRIPQLKREYNRGFVKTLRNGKSIQYTKSDNFDNIKYIINNGRFANLYE